MKFTVMTRLAITGLLLFLSACGGGGGGSGSGSSGGGGGGSEGTPYITINSITMTPTTVSFYGDITVSWDVSYYSPEGRYSISIYLSKDTVPGDYTTDPVMLPYHQERFSFQDNKATATYRPSESSLVTAGVPVDWLVGEWYAIAVPMAVDGLGRGVGDPYVFPQKLTVTN